MIAAVFIHEKNKWQDPQGSKYMSRGRKERAVAKWSRREFFSCSKPKGYGERQVLLAIAKYMYSVTNKMEYHSRFCISLSSLGGLFKYACVILVG